MRREQRARIVESVERLLTIEDVADLLQMTPRFVEQQIRLDFIEAIIVGTDIRIEPAALRRYVESRKTVSGLIRQQRMRLVDYA